MSAFGGEKQLAWCTEHDDVAWLYDDDSGSCFYTCVVEISGDSCVLVPLPKSVERAVERLDRQEP